VQVRVDLRSRRANVVEQLRTHSRLVIALSGGVDSAVLLALAAEAIGARSIVAITGRSPAVTEGEIDDARRVASTIGTAHEVVATREFLNDDYLANRADRCFHCRTELFTILSAIARDRAPSKIAYGAIADDLGEDRPGMAAARKFGILAPLLDAGFTKADIRTLSREYALPVTDKPANACLASRLPTGVRVTPERLAQVARAEIALRALGFPLVRVRHHGDVARIEVPREEVPRLRETQGLEAIVSGAGFRTHAIDPEGYRPAGSRSRDPLYSILPQPDGGQ
jgi:pyridinium-3,5-biscarboxylic acid mononucleotide sulfurtransferase